jgi:hypothetical protein
MLIPRIRLLPSPQQKIIRSFSRDAWDPTSVTMYGRTLEEFLLIMKILGLRRFRKSSPIVRIGRGDVVALLAPNHPDALALRYAAHLIGAGATFLSIPSALEDRAELIRAVDPQLLVVFPETHIFVPPGTAVPTVGIGPGSGDRLHLSEAAAGQSGDPVDCRARPSMGKRWRHHCSWCRATPSGSSRRVSPTARRSAHWGGLDKAKNKISQARKANTCAPGWVSPRNFVARRSRRLRTKAISP